MRDRSFKTWADVFGDSSQTEFPPCPKRRRDVGVLLSWADLPGRLNGPEVCISVLKLECEPRTLNNDCLLELDQKIESSRLWRP